MRRHLNALEGEVEVAHKELVVAEGFSHYDLYDKPEPVGLALARVPFFKKHL